LKTQLRQAGLVPEIWEPASGSVEKRNDEWLGLWRQPGQPHLPDEIKSCCAN
jgi:thiopurine S-methyltransferase